METSCVICQKNKNVEDCDRIYIMVGRSSYPRNACKKCLKERNLVS